MQCVDESGSSGGIGRAQGERDQPAGAAEVALPQCMSGILGQRGVEHAAHLRMPLQPLRDLGGVALVLRQAHRQRAQAAQRQVGVVGADGEAECLVGSGDALGQRRAVDHDRALHHV
ncbi:hypothetical protein D3C72_1714250 [compost metagenome]